jgi:hypothetical protein
MKRYGNLSGNSGVMSYEDGADFIKVRFIDGAVYLYTCASTGRRHVETMKRLAHAGAGLSTYISRHIREAYAARLQ